jgi:hypothetical protein
MALPRNCTGRPDKRKWAAFFLWCGLAVPCAVGGWHVQEAGAYTANFLSTKTISISRSNTTTGLGLSTVESRDATPLMIADQVDPLDPLLVNRTSLDLTPDTFAVGAQDGIVSMPLATAWNTYIWRIRAANPAEYNQFLTANLEASVTLESTGASTGTMTHTVYPGGPELQVTVIPGTITWVAPQRRIWQPLTLDIDLRNIRYSGNYSGTLRSTITWTPPP